MTGMRALLVAVLLICGTGPVAAQSLSLGGTATVNGIVDGDTVLLDVKIDGSNEVRLVGIQAPKLPLGRKGFKKWPLADEAKQKLEALVLGRNVTLKFGGRRMDRHGRLLAHLFDQSGAWVQGAMLRAGMARVYSFPDNRSVVADMLDLEQAARSGHLGIWDNSYYQLQDAQNLEGLIGTFQLIEGVVFDAVTVRGTTYLNYTEDWRNDFTVSLNKRTRGLFLQAGLDPITLKSKRIRVRGWLKKRNGPMIEATHPEQIEILGDK
jgi:micrococcal nuclease